MDVIGKRVAEAVSLQDDMQLAGICDVVTGEHPHELTTLVASDSKKKDKRKRK